MDSQLQPLLSRLESNPFDQIAWHQVKRQIKLAPEDTCCQLIFGYLSDTGSSSALSSLLIQHGTEIYSEVLQFYKNFLTKTETFGDIWGGGREFWATVQFLELWTEGIKQKLSPTKFATVSETLARLRSVVAEHKTTMQCNGLNLPFLPQEVAWNLTLYFEPSSTLADYPEFKHMYFLPSELLPLTFDLENYKISEQGRSYLKTLLHETRKSAFKTNLLHFAQNFPLLLQAKWAYAVYISLDQGEWDKHPFVLRLLANSYWEARADGHIIPAIPQCLD